MMQHSIWFRIRKLVQIITSQKVFDTMINGLFTSESVSDGHPDKICDQISDAILDCCLSQDPLSRVAVEIAFKKDVVVVMGEITSKASLDYKAIVSNVLTQIGHADSKWGIDIKQLNIMNCIQEQSPDIALGISEDENMGAGDQGMMCGFACNDTIEAMPMSIALAHKLMRQHCLIRKAEPMLGPDAKAQVTIEYQNGLPSRIDTIVLSSQHVAGVSKAVLHSLISDLIIQPIVKNVGISSSDVNIFINPTGQFVVGGPVADAGLTGRKLMVDTYGGYARHGGGAFSGKDPTKVDRSAAYAARQLAKTIVAKGLATVCEVRVAYAIGLAKPVMIDLECYKTNLISYREIMDASNIDWSEALSPYNIIQALNLRRPIYQKTATFGHFGCEDYAWEKVLF